MKDFIENTLKLKENGIRGDYRVVQGVPFYIVSDSDYANLTNDKAMPSQSYNYYDKSFVLICRSTFDYDKCYWVEHEIAHVRYYRTNKDIGDGAYPDNAVERFAFGKQIAAMRKAGLDSEWIFALLESAYVDCGTWDSKKKKFFKKLLKI